MVSTLNEIRTAIDESPTIGSVLRVDALEVAKSLGAARNAMFETSLGLNAVTIASGLAQSALLLGIYPTSPTAMISKVVHDLIQGWAISMPDDEGAFEDNTMDLRMSTVFVKELIKGSHADVTARMRLGEGIRAAFEEGRMLAIEQLGQERSSKGRKRSRSQSTPRKRPRLIVDSDAEDE